MNDMTQVIQPKSDQINADDLISGPMTIEITDVKIMGGTEQPVSMSIKGRDKVYRPCKSMSRVLVQAWGPDANNYKGRSMTLYRDPKVKWGGMEVGGIRISHLSHIDADMTLMLTASKANRAPHKVKVMQSAPSAQPVQIDPAHLQSARDAAANGKDKFSAWWKDATVTMREAANTILDELKEATAKADEGNTPVGDEPPM